MTTPPGPPGPAGRSGLPGPPPGRAPGALTLAAQLRRLGVRPGMQLMAHASLSGTGLRAEVLREALTGLLGPRGTLVVPAFTSSNSVTSTSHRKRTAGLTPAQVLAFRAHMPAYDPLLSPSEGMGVLAEAVRTAPGAARSAHPQTSFAAVGRDAERLCSGHRVESHMGEESPLGKLCWEGGQVLMINVGFSVCTAFHLAEYRIPKPPLRMYECVVKVNHPGVRQGREQGGEWTAYEDVALDDSDFAEIGGTFPDSRVRRGLVGGASAMLFSIPEAVDHAREWMTENRR